MSAAQEVIAFQRLYDDQFNRMVEPWLQDFSRRREENIQTKRQLIVEGFLNPAEADNPQAVQAALQAKGQSAAATRAFTDPQAEYQRGQTDRDTSIARAIALEAAKGGYLNPTNTPVLSFLDPNIGDALGQMGTGAAATRAFTDPEAEYGREVDTLRKAGQARMDLVRASQAASQQAAATSVTAREEFYAQRLPSEFRGVGGIQDYYESGQWRRDKALSDMIPKGTPFAALTESQKTALVGATEEQLQQFIGQQVLPLMTQAEQYGRLAERMRPEELAYMDPEMFMTPDASIIQQQPPGEGSSVDDFLNQSTTPVTPGASMPDPYQQSIMMMADPAAIDYLETLRQNLPPDPQVVTPAMRQEMAMQFPSFMTGRTTR